MYDLKHITLKYIIKINEKLTFSTFTEINVHFYSNGNMILKAYSVLLYRIRRCKLLYYAV